MRIATRNMNSARTRGERALNLMDKHDMDVLCLQETKVADDNFARALLEDAGLHVAYHGLNQWNGVAIVSREEPTEIITGFPGEPGYHNDEEQEQAREARALGAVIRNIEIWSL